MHAMKRYVSLAVMLMFVVGFLGWLKIRLMPLLAYLFAVNVVVFVLYGIDKLCALVKCLRVPEKLLHILALLGGSPMALLGQHLFNHKVSKEHFLVVYWIIVAVQVALIYAIVYTDLLKFLF